MTFLILITLFVLLLALNWKYRDWIRGLLLIVFVLLPLLALMVLVLNRVDRESHFLAWLLCWPMLFLVVAIPAWLNEAWARWLR